MTTADRLLDSVLDFIEHAPDDEFLAFLKDTGRDVHALADTARISIASALKTYGAEKRAAARAQHAQSKEAYAKQRASLPQTVAGKLEMLARLLTESADAGMQLSLSHRDLSEVPEEELDRILLQLIELTHKKN